MCVKSNKPGFGSETISSYDGMYIYGDIGSNLVVDRKTGFLYLIDKSNLAYPTNYDFKGNKGDLMLYKGKELILLNEDTNLINENGDYLKIGHTNDVENLFSSISRNKRILLWNTLNYENHLGKVKPYGYYTSIMNYFTWKIFTFFCFLLL